MGEVARDSEVKTMKFRSLVDISLLDLDIHLLARSQKSLAYGLSSNCLTVNTDFERMYKEAAVADYKVAYFLHIYLAVLWVTESPLSE
jgi:hypothetical protein